MHLMSRYKQFPTGLVADLNPTFQWTATSNKSHISSSTVSVCMVDNYQTHLFKYAMTLS